MPTPLVVAPENAEVASFNARVAELELELSQASTPNDDNDTIKENLRRYGEAVAESADPILAEPDASVALRRRAAEVKFSVTVRRLAFDPGLLGPFVKTLNRIDSKANDDSIADLTAYYRVVALCEDITLGALRELASDAFEEFVAAVSILAKVKSTQPEAAAIILQTAREAERRGLDGRALDLYARYSEKFPDEPAARFAAGSAERLRLIGQVVAAVEGPGVDGKSIALEDYRGKVVLLDYWSTLSGSWAGDLSTLRAYRKEYGPQGLEILGVNLDTDLGKVKEALNSEAIDWPQMVPAVGSQNPWETALGLRFGVSELPFHLVFDRAGRLVAFGANLVELEPALQRALAPPPSNLSEEP